MKSRIRQNSLALLAALIWGFGFSAQSMSAEYIGPFTFNCVRNIIAFVALLLIDLAAARFIPGRRNMFQLDRAEKKTLLAGGCAPDTPAAVVYKATWPEEKIVRCTVGTLAAAGDAAGIWKTAIILVGGFLGRKYERSKLYDPGFTTEFRQGTDTTANGG